MIRISYSPRTEPAPASNARDTRPDDAPAAAPVLITAPGPGASDAAEVGSSAGASNTASTGDTAIPTAGVRSPGPWLTALVAMVLALAIGLANLAVWDRLHPPVTAPDFAGPIGGLAYNAYGRWDSPLIDKRPDDASVAHDMDVLAGLTGRIRSYSSSEFPALPALADAKGLLLTAGVWLDQREDNVRREIAALERAVREHSSIERVIVGNETLLHGTWAVDDLITKMREVRRRVRKPVSTAEPWHVWLRYPELAKAADFITVHLLPYWEGLPPGPALDYAFDRLAQLQKRYPGKKIVIGEIGWPSQGDRRDGAHATPANQAEFIRGFLVRAREMKLDYYLMEGIDQPWKIDNEGRAGPYWGILDASREPKFDLAGPVDSDPGWRNKAAASSALGAILAFLFLARFPRMRLASRIAFAVSLQAIAAVAIWLVALPFDWYLRAFDWMFVALLVPAVAMTALIFLVNAFEFVELFWRGNLKRGHDLKPLAAGQAEPMVSIHLACCNEPPEMVIATIRSLHALDYRNYEVIVVDNNTRDPARWEPVRDYMAGLDARFRFFHLPSWPGFKAGALNFALEQTDPRAEIVGVVDADYQVVTGWLKNLVGHFDTPGVAVVQAPQAHRGWSRNRFRQMMNFEYDGFFRIGMHHRNERNAIIQHGTMTLVRASALRDNGNWSQWCICEDAELGLRLMKAGMETRYIDRVMGRGLTPDSFNGFKKQRRRWAEGAMQILRGHWRELFLPGPLSAGQRYHFVAGWLSWIGDALHLLFAFGAMAWTIAMLAYPKAFTLPILLFMVPLLGFFAARTLLGPLLYLRRVRCSLADVAGSALAGMALSHGIARGIWSGLIRKTAVFEITDKGSVANPGGGVIAAGTAGATGAAVDAIAPVRATSATGTAPTTPARPAAASPWGGAREEGLLFLGLMTSLAAVGLWRPAGHVESAMWMAILAMQAIPYAAALVCVALSRQADRTPRRVPTPDRPLASPALPARAGGFPALPARQPLPAQRLPALPARARVAGANHRVVPGVVAAAGVATGPVPNRDWPRRAITGYNLWFYAPRPDPESVRR